MLEWIVIEPELRSRGVGPSSFAPRPGERGHPSGRGHIFGVCWLNQGHETGQTATLSARIGAMRAFVDEREGSRIIHLSVALWRPRPLHVGASGKAILAFLEPPLRDQIIEHRLATDGSPHHKSRNELEDDLRQVRRDRIAVSRGEVNPNTMGVAAPILKGGRPIGAVGICVSAMSHSELADFRSYVRDASIVLSEQSSQR